MRREPADLLIRPAGVEDLAAITEVNLRARAAAYPAMPAGVHADAEVRAWVAGWDLTQYDVWLAASPDHPGGHPGDDPPDHPGDHPGEQVLGYARADAVWLDDLYVDPAAQGEGVGSALLEVVKAHRPDGFSLWVFESNAPARAFYRRHGLVEAEHTDGSGNEERAPDLRMTWPGATAGTG